MIAPPRKTELGQEELRQRTRKLSQRHRTVLLLVDGKRSRAEVMALAQQAGATPGLFDELLSLGMVEEASVPTGPAPLVEPEPQAAVAQPAEVPAGGLAGAPAAATVAVPEAVAEAPTEPPMPVAERVEIEIAAPVTDAPDDVLPSLRGRAPADVPQLPPDAGRLDQAPAAAEAAQTGAAELALPLLAARAEPAPTAVPTAAPTTTQSTAPAEPVSAAEPAAALRIERRVAEVAVPVERRVARAKVKFSAPSYAPPAPMRTSGPVPLVNLPEAEPDAVPLDPEQRLLSEVRSLLVGTLLIDGPVSSSLLALRVGRARSRDELVVLVWEIEHSLTRSGRPREARGRLERVHDLLGLGNTLVDEDTNFGRDSKW